MSSSDSLVSLTDIQKKCKVLFALLDEPVHLIREYNLDPNICFSCRYKIEHHELVPHFSEKSIKDANTDDFTVSCELDGKFNSKYSNVDQVCSENDTHTDQYSTVVTKSSPLIKTPPRSMAYKRRSNYTATSAINLDSEGSDVEGDVDKIKSPINPLKTLRLTPTSGEKKLSGPRLSPLKRNSSVKRILNDSFENSLTSPSGIPIYSYSIINSNCDDAKHIKIKLKLAEKETGMNLKVHPTKLDEKIIQTKSPVKIKDLQEIKNHVVFSPNAKAKMSETYSLTNSDVGSSQNLRYSRQTESPKPSAKVGSTRRRSSRNVERKSYVEYCSPEQITPKKSVRRGSTDSSYSANTKTPRRDNNAKITTLNKIEEDENKDENKKQEIMADLLKQNSSNGDEIVARSVLLNKNEVMINLDRRTCNSKLSKQTVDESLNDNTEYNNQIHDNKCDMFSSTKHENDSSGVVNKNLTERTLKLQENMGCHKLIVADGNPQVTELLPKTYAIQAVYNVKPKAEEQGTCNNRDANSYKSSKEQRAISNANNNEITYTSTNKRDVDVHINTNEQSVLNFRPKRSAVTPKRYANDDNNVNTKVLSHKQKHKMNHAKECSENADGGVFDTPTYKPVNNTGRPRKHQFVNTTAINSAESPKHSMKRLKKNFTSYESDDADGDGDKNNAVATTPIHSMGLSSKSDSAKRSMDNIESSRPIRSVGHPKKRINNLDSADHVKSRRSKRNAGVPKRYIDSDYADETEDDDTESSKTVKSVGCFKEHSNNINVESKSPRPKRSVGLPKKYVESNESNNSDYSNKKSKFVTKMNSTVKSVMKTPHSTKKILVDSLRKSAVKNSCKKLVFEDSDENDVQTSTPKTSKRGSTVGTPKSVLKDTPTARARMIREGIITPSVQARNKAVVKDSTPLSKARTQLHVSFVPKSLPCREKEFADIINFLEGKLLDGCGGCMYVSGVPGTGKTATVTEVIRNLQESVDKADLPSFKYINVNGMRLSEPRQSYVEIVKQLMGKTMHWEQAQTFLENRFVKLQKKSEPIILVVDELDILCTKRQDVVYNLLDWPTKANAQLIVITIANTMDLPERLLMGRVTSRLGLTRLTFQAYTHKQLQEIVSKRLLGISAFNPDAIQLVARKVASVSGDARRALDICRRAVEIAELEGKHTLVSMTHVNQALNAMITQPKVQAIKCCSRLEKLILQAVVAEVERTGVEETNFSSVLTMLVAIAALDGFQMVSSTTAMATVSKLGACRLLLTDQKCNDIYQRIILNVSADDVYYALTKTAI